MRAGGMMIRSLVKTMIMIAFGLLAATDARACVGCPLNAQVP